MDKATEKKLLIKEDRSILVFNAPSGLDLKSRTRQQAVVVIVFVKDRNDIDMLAPKAISKLAVDGVLWFAYPKKSSGMKTDIQRDHGWEVLAKEKFIPVTQISIDETWSALRFKPINKIEKMTRNVNAGIKRETPRIIALSNEFEKMLAKSNKAKAFYDSLSFTNRKEYALWISTAKKPETLEKRLKSTLKKLLTGKKNPSEK